MLCIKPSLIVARMVNHACVWSKAGLICIPMMWEGSALLGVLAPEPKPYRLSPQNILEGSVLVRTHVCTGLTQHKCIRCRS